MDVVGDAGMYVLGLLGFEEVGEEDGWDVVVEGVLSLLSPFSLSLFLLSSFLFSSLFPSLPLFLFTLSLFLLPDVSWVCRSAHFSILKKVGRTHLYL